MKNTMRWVFLFALGLLAAGCSDDYQSTMQSKLKKLLGPDFRKYYWFSYPTDNFGLGTMYQTPSNVVELNLDENYLCASITCLQLPNSSAETNTFKRLTFAGFADVGVGADIELGEKKSTVFTT